MTKLKVGNVDLDRIRDVCRPCLDVQREQCLLDVSSWTCDAECLADEHQWNFSGDYFVAVHHKKVHVGDGAPHGVTLQVSCHREVLFLADGEVEQNVLARSGGKCLAERPSIDTDGDRLFAVPVDDTGNAAGGAKTARRARPLILPGF